MSGRTPDEGRFSRISRRMWDDERFRALSPAPPNAQTLWQRLLTGPELGCIPGLFNARQGGLADALGWSLEALQTCWQEIADQDMAKADWRAGVVWVPNGIVHNEPASTNTVVGWRLALRELPECDLKREAVAALRAHLEAKGKPWAKAFAAALGESSPKASTKASRKPSAKASPGSSPEASAKGSDKGSDIQDQEKDKGQKTTTAPGGQQQRPESPAPDRDTKIRCPCPLPFEAGDVSGLAMDTGMTEREAAANLQAWARQQRADPTDLRPLGAWLKCAIPAIRSKWSDSKNRGWMRALANPQPDELPAQTNDDTGGYGAAGDWQ